MFHWERDYLFRNFVYSGKFPVERTKKSCSIYIPTAISRFFGKWKTLIASYFFQTSSVSTVQPLSQSPFERERWERSRLRLIFHLHYDIIQHVLILDAILGKCKCQNATSTLDYIQMQTRKR